MKRFFGSCGFGLIIGIAGGLAVAAALPAIAAVCSERVSGGIGGSGMLGGRQAVMEVAVGETAVIACAQQQRLVMTMDAGDTAKFFTCQQR
ncbi:MAG: hypothetical protein ACK4NA_15140 [Alphaproteobacteria bacterium]